MGYFSVFGLWISWMALASPVPFSSSPL